VPSLGFSYVQIFLSPAHKWLLLVLFTVSVTSVSSAKADQARYSCHDQIHRRVQWVSRE
jgi:hypothetical protein